MLQKNSQDMRLRENHGLQNSSYVCSGEGGGGELRKPYLATGIDLCLRVYRIYSSLPSWKYRSYSSMFLSE